MTIGNTEVLKKIEMLSDELENGGLMPPKVAKKFIISAVESAPLLKMMRTVMMKEPEQKFPKMTIEGRVAHAAVESETPPSANFVKPTTDEVNITTKELVSIVPLSDTVMEDNVEGKALWKTIEVYMRKKIASDVQENFTEGDITSADPDLALFDGLQALVTSNVVDGLGAAWSADLAVDGMNAIPEAYWEQEESMLRWLGAPKTERLYRLALTPRESALGDLLLNQKSGSSPLGIPMVNIPRWPTNLTPGNYSTEILMNPKQFLGGWHRNIRIEFERKATARKTYMVISMRVGCALEEELAAAKVENVLVA
ncbi:MAG: phage major capsid protein [FCB group bacterium]|nr:phage major capsid protein [FCB group bacterium]